MLKDVKQALGLLSGAATNENLFEISRGDSFQLLLADASLALEKAIWLRAYLHWLTIKVYLPITVLLLLNIARYLLAVGLYTLLLSPCSRVFQALSVRILSNPPTTGLANAGRYIGYFERTIIVILVLRGQYEAIGLLVTAKSIIRVQDARAKEESEYPIIGTLYSFMAAILVGEMCRWLLGVV